MHEYGAVIDLFKLATSVAGGRGEVREVTVELGSLTTYREQPLRFYFDALKGQYKGFSNTVLKVIPVKGVFKCGSCGTLTETDELPCIRCSGCEGPPGRIIQGTDLLLKEIVLNG